MNKTFLWGGLACAAVLAIVLFVSYNNTQAHWARLNNSCNAVFDRQRVAHDEMWKVVKSQYGLNDSQKDLYLQALNSYTERGKSYQNASFVWVQEQFPNLAASTQMAQSLANTIADQNGKLSSVRNDVVTVTNEYNNYVTNPWNQYFLWSEQEVTKESKIITSGVTENAAKTLKDDLEWMPNK